MNSIFIKSVEKKDINIFIGLSFFFIFLSYILTKGFIENEEISDFVFPSSWFQSLNPIYIICLAPIFAFFWSRIGEGKISNIVKFAIGLLFMALGWGIMIFAAFEAQKGVLVSPAWLAAMYFLHAIGEMFVSPVGLSAISRLAPARILPQSLSAIIGV